MKERETCGRVDVVWGSIFRYVGTSTSISRNEKGRARGRGPPVVARSGGRCMVCHSRPCRFQAYDRGTNASFCG